MGNCVGGFKQRTKNIVWRKNRHSKSLVIAFLGLDSAGKTTIVKALQGEGAESVLPTMGFSRGEFALSKCRVVAYDLGGADRIREIWKIYYSEIYAIVYVVDSAASSRMEENRRVVDALREHPDLTCKPILFLLNKKDLPEAIDEITFSEQFALHTMARENKTDIRVEGVCAVKGYGSETDPMIIEGMSWLIERVLLRYAQLNKEIEAALKKLRERQAYERLQRQHRLATMTDQFAGDDQTEETGVQANEAEPVPATLAANEHQQLGAPNGVATHHEASADMTKTSATVEDSVVQAHIECHPVPSGPKVRNSADKHSAEPRQTKTAGYRPLKRASNKVASETAVKESIQARESAAVDYRLFEKGRRPERRSPLRTKSFDSSVLFQPVHRPRLLNTVKNQNIEMGVLSGPNHIKDDLSIEESWSN